MTSSRHHMGICGLLTLCLYMAYQGSADANKPRAAKPRRELLPPLLGPSSEMIWDVGLVEKTVSAAALYEHAQTYYQDVSIKRFSGPVLGYVTPWHRTGYERAVLFRAKLTHVAPVWYQLKRKDGSWVLEGSHEYNKTWIDDVRAPVGEEASRPTTKIVPRIIVELETGQDHVDLVRNPEQPLKIIIDEVVGKDYDGIVLEVWMTWVMMNAVSNEPFLATAHSFIANLHQQLHGLDRERQLVLAVPPPVPASPGRPSIEKSHMQEFSDVVDLWSLMTYDYSVGSGPQPTSPIHWLETQVKLLKGESDNSGVKPYNHAAQVLMGVNFYGYDYSLDIASGQQPEAIIGTTVLEIMAKQQPTFDWHTFHSEHSFDYTALNGKHRVFYPTPRSLEIRLEEFGKHGYGVSIWELGQGLERMFDLL